MSGPAPGFHTLWPTPLGVHRYAQAPDLNPLLVRVFSALRMAQAQARSPSDGSSPGAAFFASDDDLVERIQLPEWQGFLRFVVASLRDTVKAANAGVWPAQGLDLRIGLEGMWFQMSNAGAFHAVHSHGNCSWSGVYCVQVDDEERRTRHATYGAANGVTRFFGPRFERLGGARIDMGNAYLQDAHLDFAPVPGQLLIFPSWLAHQALPYGGEQDRVIVSFNACVHAAQGSNQLHRYAAT
ncbi:MAG: putative 2OG-Fe(II) oxygenase [Rubrivivax sp.]